MKAVSIDDLREQACRRLPRAVFDYIDGAAEDEQTLRRNRAAFQDWAFSPRILVDVDAVDLSTRVVGEELTVPFVLAPTGLCGMAAARGEIHAARAAARAGVVFTASSLSAVTIEDIAAVGPGPRWFQLYIWRDRSLTASLVERARMAGYTTLIVTVDVPVLGQRERDGRNGATIPPKVTIRNAWDLLRKPAWTLPWLRHPRIEFANVAQGASVRPFALSQYVNTQFDPTVSWKDLPWLRNLWPGPILIKGIMSVEDACRAVDAGVDGIVVSNHGGRQLDGLPASLDVLPEIAEAVGERTALLFDGGIRRGSDIVKALALGAHACMVGRPYLYGLGAGGAAGVERTIEILRLELHRAMALLGRTSIADLDCTALRRQTSARPP